MTAPAPTGHVACVRFLGALARLTGHRETRITVDADTTVADLFERLAHTYGRPFSDAVFRTPGDLETHVRVFLDEREAAPTDRVVSGESAREIALLVIPGFEGGSR